MSVGGRVGAVSWNTHKGEVGRWFGLVVVTACVKVALQMHANRCPARPASPERTA